MSVRENLFYLKNLVFFQTMKQEFLELLLLGAKRANFTNNQCLFKQGESLDYATVILSGTIKLYVANSENQQGKLLDIVSAGTLLNDAGMVTKINAQFTAVSYFDSVVLQIPHRYFLKNLEDSPELALYLYGYFNQRMQYFVQDLMA